MSNLACRCAQRACASCVQVLVEFFYLSVGRGFASGAVSSLAEMCRRQWAPPTLGVTFDLGHVLVLAWEESREQAISVNEVNRTVKLRDRLQGGEKWVIVWRLCGCSLAGVVIGAECWRMYCV